MEKQISGSPDPTEQRPSARMLIEWENQGYCDATDGCQVEPDGTCEHGYPSWLLHLRMI